MNQKEIIEKIQFTSAQYARQLPARQDTPVIPQGGAVASLIDHTILKTEITAAQVETLCVEARQYGFASVCVNPIFVPLAASLLAGSVVKVCSVVGFPLGASRSDVKAYESLAAIADGAQELDMVIHVGSIKQGDYTHALDDVSLVVQTAHKKEHRVVKVILETAMLTREEKIIACLICKEAGADFVKTATGFFGGGATVEDVELMRSVVGPQMGVKAAGGVRTYEDAIAMIAAGATRIGTSGGVNIVKQAINDPHAKALYTETESY